MKIYKREFQGEIVFFDKNNQINVQTVNTDKIIRRRIEGGDEGDQKEFAMEFKCDGFRYDCTLKSVPGDGFFYEGHVLRDFKNVGTASARFYTSKEQSYILHGTWKEEWAKSLVEVSFIIELWKDIF